MADIEIEQEKLLIEREKLDLERLKAQIEMRKARWTAASVIVPILGALITIGYGFWSTNQQSKAQFQLEVAKSIMQASSEAEAVGRLNLFSSMFPSFIPEGFAKIPKGDLYNRDEVNAKKDFVKMVAERGLTPQQVLALWAVMFGDPWPKDPAVVEVVRGDQPPAAGAADEQPQATGPRR
jgi:hypothetical protein